LGWEGRWREGGGEGVRGGGGGGEEMGDCMRQHATSCRRERRPHLRVRGDHRDLAQVAQDVAPGV
jgi:hypothetical protein